MRATFRLGDEYTPLWFYRVSVLWVYKISPELLARADEVIE